MGDAGSTSGSRERPNGVAYHATRSRGAGPGGPPRALESMAEIITESFCERCGTRYTFETVQAKGRTLGALGTLGRGLKHFVAMPDSSFDEAMAVARSETEQRVTTAQLEAFHRTFNFCLSCRQYTCSECWNAVEGRCLTCAPLPQPEIAHAEAAPARPLRNLAVEADADEAPVDRIDLARHIETPTAEVAPPVRTIAPAAEAMVPEPEPVIEEPEPEIEPEPEVEPEPEIEPVIEEPEPEIEPEPEPVAIEPEPEIEPEPAIEPEAKPAVVASPSTPTPGRVALPEFLPGRSLDDEIAAYELRVASLAAAPPEPLPPVVVEATRTPAAVPMERPPVATSRVAASLPVAPVASSPPAAGTCRSCGLSLSASARFCRRCGTAQVA